MGIYMNLIVFAGVFLLKCDIIYCNRHNIKGDISAFFTNEKTCATGISIQCLLIILFNDVRDVIIA